MPIAKWTHDMIRTGLLALVFFALLHIGAKRFGSEVPGLQKIAGVVPGGPS